MEMTKGQARLVWWLRSEAGFSWRKIADAWDVLTIEEEDETVHRVRARQALGQALVAMAEEVLGYEHGSADDDVNVDWVD